MTMHSCDCQAYHKRQQELDSLREQLRTIHGTYVCMYGWMDGFEGMMKEHDTYIHTHTHTHTAAELEFANETSTKAVLDIGVMRKERKALKEKVKEHEVRM